jgi:tetratricopeptide (TPR) repeat protein
LEQNPKMNSQLEGIQILACQHQYEIVGTLLSRFPFGCDLLEKALAINPNDPFALANGSRCFKDEQKAQGMLEKAMSLKQNWAYPYYELGLRKFDQAKYEEAENLFKKAIEINPDSVLLHMKLADSLKGQKKYSEEIRTLKEMSHLLKSRYKDLKIKNYNSLLGFAYFHMGEYQFAERYLRKFLAQDPTEISKTQRFEALVGLGEAIYGQRFEGCDKGEVNMNMIRAAIEPFLEAQKMKEYSNRNWDCVQKYLKEIKKIERRSFWGRVKKVITFKDLRDLLSGRA